MTWPLPRPNLKVEPRSQDGVELLARLPRDTDVVHFDDAAGNRFVAFADFEVLRLELVGRRLVARDVDLRLLVRGHGGHGSYRRAVTAARPSSASATAAWVAP
jgi:hypothetical protein